MRNFLSSIKSTYFTSKALVLMYHKIGNPPSDPWELAVSQENFEAHLQVLQKSYNVISSDELISQLQQNKIKNKSVALTFDDGLLNNYELARPLLQKYNIPATFFITDSNIGKNKPFWWDELEETILNSEKLPKKFDLNILGNRVEFSLNGESILTPAQKVKNRNFIAYEPNSKRAELYYRLWEICSPLKIEDQHKIIAQIKDWAGTEIAMGTDICMTWKQVEDLSKSALFTIGGHTHSHPSLYDHSAEYQKREILDNKKLLESKLGININSFAYPSGRYDDNTLKVINGSGYKGAFTTRLGTVKNKSDVGQINRYQVCNWDKDKFNTEIVKWFKK